MMVDGARDDWMMEETTLKAGVSQAWWSGALSRKLTYDLHAPGIRQMGSCVGLLHRLNRDVRRDRANPHV